MRLQAFQTDLKSQQTRKNTKVANFLSITDSHWTFSPFLPCSQLSQIFQTHLYDKMADIIQPQAYYNIEYSFSLKIDCLAKK